MMNSIAVFCASSTGNKPAFAAAAEETGILLAQKGITLVYGGGRVGLMGVVADAALQAGGRVIGVIPRFLATAEIAHPGLSELLLVESMHERKMKMSELCEGVVALPGGFGTLEELTEMLTWSQLQLHHKPIGILNIRGYYDFLEKLFDQMVDGGLLRTENRQLAIFDENVETLLENMKKFQRPGLPRTLDRDKT